MRFVVKEPDGDPMPGWTYYSYLVWDTEANRIVGRHMDISYADQQRDHLEWYHTLPAGERTSSLLKRVRQVLSTAENVVVDNWGGNVSKEEQLMLSDLQIVINTLRKWQRTKGTPHGKTLQKGE